MSHTFDCRVYYEDTDFGGVVYYANYLKFIERARTELLRSRGIDQLKLRDNDGVTFVVRRVEADYLAPAQFDDALSIETDLQSLTGVRVVMKQVVKRGESILFEALVTLVAVGSDGRPVRLPAGLRRELH